MTDSIAEIKSRLPIEELVSQYVQLKKVGRSLKGLCPFHSEKTPSFIVSPERGIAYCFGCHKGGDIFKFMQEMEGGDFVDSLKILAEKTGVKLENYPKEQHISKDEKQQFLDIHEIASSFFEKNLNNTKDGEKVLEYLHKRGLSDETIKNFRLGFSEDSFENLSNLLLKKGFTKKMLIDSGIAAAKEVLFENIYDRFRGRLMFPIFDTFSRIIAFGGRALKQDQEPKYLNSPESPIYHKSNILYGFSHSKSFIKKAESALVVEGYMDFLAAYQAGVKNVVASSGTALALSQIRILQPLVNTFYFAFDMDLAGQEASKRAYELIENFNFEVKMVKLPLGKDIAEFAKEHHGELQKIIDEAKSYGEYFYEHLFGIYSKDDLVSKRKILQEFSHFFTGLKSSVQKDFFVRKLAHDLSLKEVQIYDEMKNFKLSKFHPARNHSALDTDSENKLKRYLSDELLLGFLLEFPRISSFYKDKLTEELFSEELKPIYKAFLDNYNAERDGDTVKDFLAGLPYGLISRANVLSLYVTERYGEISEQVATNEIEVLINSLKKNSLDKKKKALQIKIMEAEKSSNMDLRLQLLTELNNLHIKDRN